MATLRLGGRETGASVVTYWTMSGVPRFLYLAAVSEAPIGLPNDTLKVLYVAYVLSRREAETAYRIGRATGTDGTAKGGTARTPRAPQRSSSI